MSVAKTPKSTTKHHRVTQKSRKACRTLCPTALRRTAMKAPAYRQGSSLRGFEVRIAPIDAKKCCLQPRGFYQGFDAGRYRIPFVRHAHGVIQLDWPAPMRNFL